VLSTEHPRYGGFGTPPVDSTEAGWQLPAECAVVLAPEPAGDDSRGGVDRRARPDRRALPTPFT
jgi:hypothetical protein